jgi:hypothetical protein
MVIILTSQTGHSSQLYVKHVLSHGLQVFISLSVILGDGTYNLIKILYHTIKRILDDRSKQGRLPLVQLQNGTNTTFCSLNNKSSVSYTSFSFIPEQMTNVINYQPMKSFKTRHLSKMGFLSG